MKQFFSTILAVVLAVTGVTANAADWYVSGSGAILNGKTWDHTASVNKMVQQNDGTYKLEVTDCTLEVGSTYEWLVTDGTNWIKTGGNNQGSNFTITVTETAKYKVVYTFDGNQTASATVTKTGSAGQVTHSYSVAGDPASIFGASWDAGNTATDMSLNNDGLYEWTSAQFSVTDAALNIQFKVVQDHAWGIAYPSSNYQVTAPVGGPYTLTITFDENSKAVNATLNSNTPINHTYSVAGSNADIFGAEWDASNTSTDMVLNNDGLYQWTSAEFSAAEAYTLKFKVVEDHAWAVAYPSEDYEVAVPAGGPYTLTITFDADSKDVNATLNSSTPINHTYSIAGRIGADEGDSDLVFTTKWDASQIATEMVLNQTTSLYEWTSGEFTVTAADEIQFKVVEDHAWTNAWPSDNYVVAVPVGGPYTLTVTFDASTHDVAAVLNGAPVVTDVYSVVGAYDATESGAADAVFVKFWDIAETATEMTLNQTTGLYEWTSAEFSANNDGSLAFKVAKNHSWDNAWPSSDYTVNVPAGGPYTLTVTFDGAQTVNAVLNGAPVVTDVYSVVGAYDATEAGAADAVFVKFWDIAETATEMTLNASTGVYSWTSAEFSANEDGTLEFKVAKNHSWDETWPSSNYEMTVPAGGPYTLTVTFDGQNVSAVLNGLPVVYTVAGAFSATNGDADPVFTTQWDVNQTANDMTLSSTGMVWKSPAFGAAANDKILFKVVKDRNWDTCWPADFNCEVTVEADGHYRLNVNFDPETEIVTGTLVNAAGDLDGTGEIDVNDVVILAEIAMGGAAPAGFELWMGDMDGNGAIDVNDVVILAGMVMGN